ncbi:hypothetical protein H0I39_19685 [Ottowia beijingensis]|uniref:Uncharacterized protein n=1 Tax=Ottowia beijingensis TaxID=1207057 RepID=A0A853IZK9_9BURK|nr:hypothetical protein [Ottowia beijingensis]NZA03379.1 hypothetical protein [Ottowia beijingensis]
MQRGADAIDLGDVVHRAPDLPQERARLLNTVELAGKDPAADQDGDEAVVIGAPGHRVAGQGEFGLKGGQGLARSRVHHGRLAGLD